MKKGGNHLNSVKKPIYILFFSLTITSVFFFLPLVHDLEYVRAFSMENEKVVLLSANNHQRSFLPIVFNNFSPPVNFKTRIIDITSFLETCPNNDDLFTKAHKDFSFLKDGVAVNNVPCTEPFSLTAEKGQLSQELMAQQVYRVAFYLDPGIPNYLPWTSTNLYSWMKSNITGINFKSEPGLSYCCDIYNGKRYIAVSEGTFQDEKDDTWTTVSNLLAFYIHETRHADPFAPMHVNGCIDFPNPNDAFGCDQTYDIKNLGGYGVSYWMHESFLTGYLDVGINCKPDKAQNYIDNHISQMNSLRRSFVQPIPDSISPPNPPYGGTCYK